MAIPFVKNLTSALTPTYAKSTTQPEKPVTADQDTLRIFIGLLGFLLPFLLLGALKVWSNYSKPLESISHYYYTRASSIFTFTLGLLALILIIYKGKRPIDFILSAIAGLFAVCVVLFPTTNLAPDCQDKSYLYAITFIDPAQLHPNFHFFSAAVFLLSLAAMSFFRFPQADSSDEKPTSLDKFMYKACGIVIVVALAIIGLGKRDILFDKACFSYPYSATFWMESVAVCTFGYSWLLKAGFFTKFYEFLVGPVR